MRKLLLTAMTISGITQGLPLCQASTPLELPPPPGYSKLGLSNLPFLATATDEEVGCCGCGFKSRRPNEHFGKKLLPERWEDEPVTEGNFDESKLLLTGCPLTDGWLCPIVRLRNAKSFYGGQSIETPANQEGHWWMVQAPIFPGTVWLQLELLDDAAQIQDLLPRGTTSMIVLRQNPPADWLIGVKLLHWKNGAMWSWKNPSGARAYYLPTFWAGDSDPAMAKKLESDSLATLISGGE